MFRFRPISYKTQIRLSALKYTLGTIQYVLPSRFDAPPDRMQAPCVSRFFYDGEHLSAPAADVTLAKGLCRPLLLLTPLATGDRVLRAEAGVVGAPVHSSAINEIYRRVDEEGVTSRWCSGCTGCATVFLFCC